MQIFKRESVVGSLAGFVLNALVALLVYLCWYGRTGGFDWVPDQFIPGTPEGSDAVPFPGERVGGVALKYAGKEGEKSGHGGKCATHRRSLSEEPCQQAGKPPEQREFQGSACCGESGDRPGEIVCGGGGHPAPGQVGCSTAERVHEAILAALVRWSRAPFRKRMIAVEFLLSVVVNAAYLGGWLLLALGADSFRATVAGEVGRSGVLFQKFWTAFAGVCAAHVAGIAGGLLWLPAAASGLGGG